MKKEFYIIICTAISSLFYSFNARANHLTEKKINNQFYSIVLPTHWIPADGMKGNGMEPEQRELQNFKLYTLTWMTPVKSMADIPNVIGIVIQSYQRKDKAALSIKEIEEFDIKRYSDSELKKENIIEAPGYKQFSLTRKSRETDGSLITYRYFYMLKQNKNMIHCINISLRESYYQKCKAKLSIDKILNSFIVN